jgi:AmmeMemoRadiSam system protein B
VAVNHGGWPALALRDPLGLSQNIVVVPQPVAPLLALCDGTRDVAGLRAGFAVRTGILLAEDEVARLIDRLDDALLLENDRFAAASQAQLETYRSAPFRPPALAGASYPAEPEALRHYLQRFLTDMPPTNAPAPGGRGLVSPHIDYSRGGQVYAQVWSQATSMVTHADLAVILGTDHHGGLGSITLTRQNYATPFGVLPTAQDEVGAVAEALGSEAAFAEELHHRREHSVELAAIWLHFMRNGEAIELVPILCGSFAHFVMGLADPRADDNIDTAVKALRQATAGRQVVVIAAGDLAHAATGLVRSGPGPISGRSTRRCDVPRQCRRFLPGHPGRRRPLSRVRSPTDLPGFTPSGPGARHRGRLRPLPCRRDERLYRLHLWNCVGLGYNQEAGHD